MTKNRALTKPMSNFFILKLLLMITFAGCNQQTPTPYVSPSPEIITVVVTSVPSNPQVETPDPTETPTLEAKEMEEPETIVTIVVTATPTPTPTSTYTPSPSPTTPPPSPEEPADPPDPDETTCVPQPATEALGIEALYPIATNCGPGQTWAADLWVQPKGGDCCYKYYIDGVWKAGPTSKGVSIHFNLSSCGDVVKTVSVEDSGGQITSEGFYIPAPSCCGN